jgi:hypothetical protein
MAQGSDSPQRGTAPGVAPRRWSSRGLLHPTEGRPDRPPWLAGPPFRTVRSTGREREAPAIPQRGSPGGVPAGRGRGSRRRPGREDAAALSVRRAGRLDQGHLLPAPHQHPGLPCDVLPIPLGRSALDPAAVAVPGCDRTPEPAGGRPRLLRRGGGPRATMSSPSSADRAGGTCPGAVAWSFRSPPRRPLPRGTAEDMA